ncbi:MFS general substrate transporter [Aspergillus heteromorphus CBS 117.55]|uniref:MFS general substrate transporter n=1 Tax=Aspergillus heteromorphus CBS 117.55 TaxID=1448321 RepID=A0A317WV94_9EURO|nr:MFS general substrate transporter [Aspergillus heteromorphus CBS 117.55]PWY89222.1 MFS general substrate transporter [Aspergillus heteromorphus CBS 117.55]
MSDARGPVIGVSIAFFVVASICVILRFYTRIAIVKNVHQHDYWCLLAWMVDFGFTFSLLYAASNGLGLPSASIDPECRDRINPAMMTVKTSFLVFYLSFAKGHPTFRLAIYATLFVVNVAGLVLTFLNVFQCSPVAAAFTSSLRSTAKCLNVISLALTSAPVNILTGLAILFLPIPMLTNMNLPRSQKVIVTGLFGCGIFVTIIDVIRIIYIQRAVTDSEESSLTQGQTDGTTLVEISAPAALSMMWSVAEVNMAVICTCIPLLKPLVVRVVPAIIGVTHKKHGSTKNSLQFPAALYPSLPSPNAVFFSNRQITRSASSSSGTFAHKRNTRDSDARLATQRGYQGSTDMLEHAYPLESRLDAQSTGALPMEFSPTNQNYGFVDFVDFVQMNKPKSMLKLTNKESLAPLAIVAIIFFVWGFSYGLLGTLGIRLQDILGLNSWQFLGNHSAYFSGYLLSPLLIGRWTLKKWGFKGTFITGLCLYACGTLIFWPSAVLLSYPAFVVSNLVIGIGLGVLETASDSFIALCGPPEYAEIRLNFVQGIQATASVVSPLLAQKVLFRSVTRDTALVDPQWTYLSIAFFVLILAVVLYYVPLPEAPDEDLEELATHNEETHPTKIMGVPVIWITLVLGATSLYFYTAGQEILSTSFETLVSTSIPNSRLSPFDYLTIGHAIFAAGRFITAFVLYLLKPRWVLSIAYTCTIIFSILCMSTSGTTAVIMGLLVYLFESGIFSTVFTISLRRMGRHTKTAAPILATAVSGGAFLPFAQYGVSESHGVTYSYCVLVAVFCAGAVFPLYLTFVPKAKRQIDPRDVSMGSARRGQSGDFHGTSTPAEGQKDHLEMDSQRGSGS